MRKLDVLTDHHCVGKDLALVDEKVWFPFILDSGAFTTVVPKLLAKELKEAGSGVIGVPLEDPVRIRAAVKNVLTGAKSMVHLTVQITTRTGPVRIRRLRAMAAQDS
jgi:hypothetical protein